MGTKLSSPRLNFQMKCLINPNLSLHLSTLSHIKNHSPLKNRKRIILVPTRAPSLLKTTSQIRRRQKGLKKCRKWFSRNLLSMLRLNTSVNVSKKQEFLAKTRIITNSMNSISVKHRRRIKSPWKISSILKSKENYFMND